MSDSSKKENIGSNIGLVRQPHGGALSPGNPGNKGGPGRPSDAIRERLKGSFEQRIHVYEEIADSTELPADTRLKAMNAMGTFGIGQKTEIKLDNTQALDRAVRALVPVLDSYLTPEQADECLNALKSAFAE